MSSQPSTYDGVILRHDQVGTIGTASAGSLPNATGGRTLTHEVGHYLNLHHPFSRSTNPSCANANGDNIGDTPLALSANYGCNTSTNSCSNETPDLPDMIENHMDYADCPNTFTQGQKSEMKRGSPCPPGAEMFPAVPTSMPQVSLRTTTIVFLPHSLWPTEKRFVPEAVFSSSPV